MKKILTALCAAAVLFVLTGCAPSATPNTLDEIAEAKKFVDACHVAGGKVHEDNRNGALYCDLTDK